jgi:V/A-type H+-transporting ATPase subunit I
VSFFADIVSYIRLGAVGLAGLAISQAVNGMASGLLRVPVAFAFGAIILVFGHGINLAMGGLSVVVHGVRLNMLEFSGHMNMEWSGYRYEPFKETADE